MRTTLALVLVCTLLSISGYAQLSGTKTVGGTSPDYVTLTDAVTALNAQGVADPGVTFLIRSGTYDVGSGLTISTTSTAASRPVTFKPDAGATVIIERLTAGSVITVNAGIGFIILDGSNATGGSSRDMTVRNALAAGSASIAVNFLGTNTNCVVKNLVVDAGANTAANRVSTSSIAIRQHWGGSAESDNFTIENNEVKNAGIGIRVEGNSTTPLLTGSVIAKNVVHTVGAQGILTLYSISPQIYGNDVQVSEGTGTGVFGISLTTSVVGNFRIYNNRIYNVKTSTTTTSTTAYSGAINVSSTGTANSRAGSIFNNFIYDINATAATGTAPVAGIVMAAGSPGTNNADTLAFNSINLTGSNAANRVSAGIAYTSATSGHKIYLRNNIISNTLVSGTAATVGILKSNASTTLSSDNNNIYIGTPSATALTGRISTTDYQSLPEWRVGSSQDNNSIAENPPFTSPTNLNIPDGTPTQMESAGVTIAGITTDINGATRNASTPDMGADEFAGVPVDLTGPAIIYTALQSTTSTSNRTLVATITDGSGVAQGAGAPRIYYRKGNAGAYMTATATAVSGDDYSFTIDHAALGGVSEGDLVQYYIAAQDSANNTSTSPAGGSGTTPPGSTPPASPNQYKIIATYVWQGTTDDFQLASNWLPQRTVPDASDRLIFDGAVIANTVVNNIPSQTVAKLRFVNDVDATLNGAAANTLSINGSAADTTFYIDEDSKVELGTTTALSIAFTTTTGQMGIIEGDLDLNTSSSYNAANSITRVVSTGDVSANGTGNFTGTTSTLFIDSAAVYKHNKNGATVPAATYHPASILEITGTTTATSLTIPAKPGNVVYDSPGQTTNLSFGSSIDSIMGNFTVVSTGTGRIDLGNSPNVQVKGDLSLTGGTLGIGNFTSGSGLMEVIGNATLDGGTLLLSSAASGTATYQLVLLGNLVQNAGNTISRLNTSSTSATTINFSGTTSQAVTFNGSITNNISFLLNNDAGVVINGAIPVNQNASHTITKGGYTGPGSFVYNATTSTLVYNGAADQTATAVEFPATDGPTSLTVSKSATTSLTLPFSRTLPVALTMTAGDINLGTNNLTLGASATSTGSLTFTSGAIRVTSGTFTRWFGTTGMPSTPVGSAGLFPLASGANSRSVHIYSSAQATSGGTITIGHNNVPGTTAINIFDNPTQLDTRTNSSWTVNAANGFAMAGSTMGLRITAGNLFLSTTPADLRLIQAASAAGTAIIGTGTFPTYLVARSELSLADFSQAHYVGAPAGNMEVVFSSIANGNWSSGSTWDVGSAPGSGDMVTITSGTIVSADAAVTGNYVTIQTGATLNVPTSTLSITNNVTNNGTVNISGGTMVLGPTGGGNKLFTNNGVLSVSSGNLHVNGALINAHGSTFNQSGGDIVIDGNDGTSAGSVAITSDLLGFGTSSSSVITTNVTGGNITIVDPHFTGTATSTAGAALAFRAAASSGRTFDAAHTTTFGGTTGTNSSDATHSFFVDCYVNSSQLVLGNVVINSGADKKVKTDAISGGGGLNVGGNLTINSGSELLDSTAAAQGVIVAGNIVNNGVFTQLNSSGLKMMKLSGVSLTTIAPATTAQTISGAGVYRNHQAASTANFSALTINNTSTDGVTYNGPSNLLRVSGAVTITAGKLNADEIDFSGTTTQTASIAAAGSLNVVNLIASNSVTFSGAGPANVTGQLFFNGVTGKTITSNGQLTLKSSAARTAYVLDITGNTISGNVVVERYIPASGNRAWRLLSAPVTSATAPTLFNSWQEGGTAPAGYGTHITDLNGSGSNGFDASSISVATSARYFDGTTTQAAMNTNVAKVTDNGAAWFLFVRGDRTIDINNATASGNTTLRMRGTINQGHVTTGVAGASFSLIPNPYPSNVDYEAVYSGNGSTHGTYYIWDANLGTVGGYRTVERTGAGTYQQTPAGGSATADNSIRYIQSGQAFFIPANTQLQFTEAMKSYQEPTINVFRPTTVGEQMLVNLNIKNGSSTLLTDAVRAKYGDTYSAAVTTEDAPKLNNFTENLAIVRSNKLLSIEKRPFITTNDTIFLKLTGTGIKNYSFTIEPLNLSASGLEAYLEDAFLGTSTQLSLSSATDVDFSITSNTASAADNRFRIVFKQAGTLPVSGINIKAAKQGEQVRVDFEAINEHNMVQYDIQRSANGTEFNTIATKAAIANNGTNMLYSAIDNQPINGDNYYRIKAIDKSGRVQYSSIARVKMGNGKEGIVVYPNPVRGEVIGLQMQNLPEGKYNVQLFNNMGQEVFRSTINHQGGSSSQSLNVAALSSKGIYTLKVSNGATTITQTIVTQ